MPDCYPVAAVRHLIDADILYTQHRFDNAMCHYAFSVECVLKAFASNPPTIHEIDRLQDLVCVYTELLHPKFALLLGTGKPPLALIQDHPGRRYYSDIAYTDEEMRQAQQFTHSLVDRLIDAELNGQNDA